MRKISWAQSVVSSAEVKAAGALQRRRGARRLAGDGAKHLSVSGCGKVKGSSDFGGREIHIFGHQCERSGGWAMGDGLSLVPRRSRMRPTPC